ncbi:UPF0235 protein C15orf40 homolog [Pecten maximus]|uniref:UPF0235 protein C15orf40 homolog n=1 Tax=Pecten maximus TaxID=6579 RepID=UPI001457F02B|nr:UPF0235 protein C15orf40 homolog [Pecten maximus]
MSDLFLIRLAQNICKRVPNRNKTESGSACVSIFRNLSSTNTCNMPPKKHKKGEKGTSSAVAGAATPGGDNSGAVVTNPNSTVTIKILAKPGAKFNAITGVGEEGVGVQISAPPVDGEANIALVKYLSKVLGVRKSDVSLDKGSRSRQKMILVSGMDRQSVLEKLYSQVDVG